MRTTSKAIRKSRRRGRWTGAFFVGGCLTVEPTANTSAAGWKDGAMAAASCVDDNSMRSVYYRRQPSRGQVIFRWLGKAKPSQQLGDTKTPLCYCLGLLGRVDSITLSVTVR